MLEPLYINKLTWPTFPALIGHGLATPPRFNGDKKKIKKFQGFRL
jgi:hypothetical protein